jgi:hypothetical protein
MVNHPLSSIVEEDCEQGCPLSPLLFILVMEGLSLLLKKGHVEGKLSGIKVSRIVKILHLLFVDDVLIMTNDSLQEWREIKEILKIFCCTTRLQINWSKSTFHYANMQDQTLEQLKGIFPYSFMSTFCKVSNTLDIILKMNTIRLQIGTGS